MKYTGKKGVLLFLMTTMMCLGVMGQRKTVTIQITREADGYRTKIDTTFTVDDESEIDVVLEDLEMEADEENAKLEKVIIIRDADDRNVHVNVNRNSNNNNSSNKAMMGVYLETAHGDEGVTVTSVVRDGAAERGGMKQGDVIIMIDDEEVEDYDELVEIKEDYRPGDEMEVVFLRGGERESTMLVLTGKTNKARSYTYNYHQHKPKAFLGVYTDDLSPDQARRLGLTSQQGVYIEGVVPGSGAEGAELKGGDVITGIDGRPLDASFELGDALAEHEPGETIEISYIRDGKACSTEARLTGKEEMKKQKPKVELKKEARAFLGVNLENHHNEGVRITSVVDNSAAEEAGLRGGDIILEIGGEETENYHELAEAMDDFRPGQKVNVVYLRNGDQEETNVVLGSKTITKWVNVEYDEENDDDEDVRVIINLEDEDVEVDFDLEQAVEEFDDQELGQQVRRYMTNPNLDMELFEFFPNPNNGRFTLRFIPETTDDLQIRVFNSRGQEVYQEYIQEFSGEYNKEIDLSRNAAKGVYFIQLTQGQRGMVDRMIVR